MYKDMCIVYVQNFRDKMVWLVLGNVDIVCVGAIHLEILKL